MRTELAFELFIYNEFFKNQFKQRFTLWKRVK